MRPSVAPGPSQPTPPSSPSTQPGSMPSAISPNPLPMLQLETKTSMVLAILCRDREEIFLPARNFTRPPCFVGAPSECWIFQPCEQFYKGSHVPGPTLHPGNRRPHSRVEMASGLVLHMAAEV